MKHRTITVSLAAGRDPLFAYLANLENLPGWAPSFCRRLRRAGRLWLASTPAGDCYVALPSDPRTGVIDLLLGEQADEPTLIPLRVVGRPHGCAVICTLFQPAEWTDEAYELAHRALQADLRGLAGHFGAGAGEASDETGPLYPSLVTARFYETWDFYAAHLGFHTVCESDVYVQLAHSSGAQLGILRHETGVVEAAELVSATDGRGFWLNLDVADADAEQARLLAAGVAIASPIADKPWGDRQFVVRDPNGVLIAISHRIDPARAARAEPAVA